MIQRFDKEANKFLDAIIEARRTIRAFAPEEPPRADIEKLIEAGAIAPYAALSVAGRLDFRRFFVFSQETPARREAGRLIRLEAKDRYEKAIQARAGGPVDEKYPKLAFLSRLKMIADNGHPSLALAPYYIVIAEYQGVPASGLQSLGHVLENMWLKATALGLAFQLISFTESMAGSEPFLRLLGLPPGEFVLDGCCVGYPAADPSRAPRPDMTRAVKWL